jgi:predicted house-cleaning noncanonical NTP pyrophosphatase (MazG superfamily)
VEKLIRDNIADFVFKNRNEVLDTRLASEEEYFNFIKQKVVEEANEILNTSTKEELIEEVADLLEVLKSLCEKNNIVEEVFTKRNYKFLERGGFDKGVILINGCKK